MGIFYTVFNFFGSIFGYVLYAAFILFKNFGVSIIVFTVIMKLIQLPFSFKQQRSMAANARLQQKQKELKEKYGNNKQKYNEEVQKLYEQEHMSPFSGCSSSLIPMVIMLGIYYSVVQPITNTLHIPSEIYNGVAAYINQIPGISINSSSIYSQIDVIRLFNNPQSYKLLMGDPKFVNLFSSPHQIQSIKDLSDGFSFLGLDLLSIPKSEGFISWAMLIPALVLISSIGSQFLMQRMNGNPMSGQKGCMSVVMYLFPLLTTFIAYSLPCAVGFYWICSTVISFLQSWLLSTYYSPAYLTAKSEAQHVALLELKEAKVKYNYQPVSAPAENDNKNKNTKNKKKK